MGWVFLVLLVITLIVVVHCVRGMSFRDRITAALDIVQSTDFSPAEGFEQARKEDPDLVGWVRSGKDCVMLFRSSHGKHVKEVVDIVSASIRPGLVVHYDDDRAVRTDEGELIDERLQEKAEELLRRVRGMMRQTHAAPLKEYDGIHI